MFTISLNRCLLSRRQNLSKRYPAGIGRNGPSFSLPESDAGSLLDIGGARLSYQECGSGACLLTFHGGLGLDHTYLRPWLDPLCASLRVVFHDLRGHGKSAGRETLESATHKTFIDDADLLRAQIGAERVAVFGHSYGGFLALEYALRYPQRVSALVLCACSASLAHIAASLEIARERATEQEYAALQQLLSRPAEDDAEFARAWQVLVPLYFHNRDSAIAPFATTTFSAAAHNRGAFALLPSYDVSSRLHEISAPALVLSGRHDWLMPPHLAGAPLAAQLPAARHVVFEQSGHFPFIEENQSFTTTVREWFMEFHP